jgi:hypothetical protein
MARRECTPQSNGQATRERETGMFSMSRMRDGQQRHRHGQVAQRQNGNRLPAKA